MGEFETVMQTGDEVEGMHNYREFCQQHVTKMKNWEPGAGNGERGTEVWKRVVSGKPYKNPKWPVKDQETDKIDDREAWLFYLNYLLLKCLK